MNFFLINLERKEEATIQTRVFTESVHNKIVIERNSLKSLMNS